MKIKLTPLRFFDLLAACILLFVLIFTPLLPSSQEKVKLITAVAFSIPRQTKDIPAPKVSASAVFIYDPDSGTALYEKNINDHLYPASTTKLMTALTALNIYQPDEILMVKNGKVLGNSVDLQYGNQLTVENLLSALLINSGNDAALTLAQNYPGGYDQFVAKMNEIAGKLGLSSTSFANPSGLVNPNHFTTAKDLTILANEAIRNSLIRKIVNTKFLTITDISGKHKYPLYATNQLLGYAGVKGLKTGWTPESKEVLVTFVERNGHTIIVTVLNSDDRFGESKKLIDWVYNTFAWETI